MYSIDLQQVKLKFKEDETTRIQNSHLRAHGVGTNVFPRLACNIGMEQTEKVDRELSATGRKAYQADRQSEGSHLYSAPSGGDSGNVGGALNKVKPRFSSSKARL